MAWPTFRSPPPILPHMRKDPALPEAAFDDDVAAVKRLVKRGVHLESVDESGQTALGNAALGGNVTLVKFLLAAGANAKHVSRQWKSSALHLAAEANAPEVVKVLLRAGTKPAQKDFFGKTALDVPWSENTRASSPCSRLNEPRLLS